MWKNHAKRGEVHSHEGPQKNAWKEHPCISGISIFLQLFLELCLPEPHLLGPTNHEIVGNADPPMALRGVSRYCFKQPLPEAKFRDIKIQVLPDPLPFRSPRYASRICCAMPLLQAFRGVLKFHLQELSVNQRGIWLIL